MSETPEEGSYDFAPEEESGEIPLVEPEGGVAEEEVSGASAVAPAARKPEQAVPDRICPHCGQNIFGKTRGGRCPQCAAPLEHAATDLLQFSSPAWLRTMATGLMMVGAAIGGHVVGAALQWNEPLLGVVLHAAAAGLIFIGALTATRMESDIGGKVMTGTGVARWAALAAVVLWGLVLLLALGGHRSGGIARWLTVLALACDGGFAIAFGLYTRALAQRVPDDGLATQSFNLSWMAGSVCVALMAIQALGLAAPEYLTSFLCSFPMIGGFLVVIAWSMVVVLRTSFELRAAAVAGESISAKRALAAQNQANK